MNILGKLYKAGNAINKYNPFNKDSPLNPGNLTEESASTKKQRADLDETGLASNQFAEYNQGGYQALTGEAAAQRDALRRQALGQDSLSSEQLRQGLQQNLASQRSMAAGASPQNSAMAARNAAMNMGRAASGMSGAAATAGIQERQAAQNALSQMILQQRGQDLQGALGSRQNAISGYGGIKPEGTKLDQYAPLIKAGGDVAAAISDERAKTGVQPADGRARSILDGLKAYTYRYKDASNGAGPQVGVMAQDMERAGLGHAVRDTPNGKMVDAGKAATSSLALTAALAERVKKLEGRGR